MPRPYSTLVLVLLTGCDQLFGIASIPPTGSQPDGLVVDASNLPPNCFHDGFDQQVLDPDRWRLWSAASTPDVVVRDNHLSVIPATTEDPVPHYNGAETIGAFDLTDGSVAVQLVEVTDQSAAPAVETQFYIQSDSMHRYLFNISKNGVQGRLYAGSNLPTVKGTAYSPLLHWLQFRHDSAVHQVHFEVSGDGTPGSWETLFSLPDDVSMTALRVGVGAGTYGPSPSPGQASFDNVLVVGLACNQ